MNDQVRFGMQCKACGAILVDGTDAEKVATRLTKRWKKLLNPNREPHNRMVHLHPCKDGGLGGDTKDLHLWVGAPPR